MPNRILLLGAGFSRNWGGWVASELSDNLLDQPEIDDFLRGLLLQHRQSGFEAVLDMLQTSGHPKLKDFEAAVLRTFQQMNNGFAGITNFEFTQDSRFHVKKFLTRFDAIFTLNQDDLMEMHYLNVSPELLSDGRFDGATVLGMRRDPLAHPFDKSATWTQHTDLPTLHPRIQPYIKLHGSSNWRSPSGNLLVIGGNKTASIAREPILKWGKEAFDDALSKEDTRLMVIGYGFRDHHINKAVLEHGRDLKMFLVNPDGDDAINWEMKGGQIPAKSDLYKRFQPLIRGISVRQLSGTFSGREQAEHGKLSRFLD